MATALDKVKISHNDIEEIDRGVWRKFNPYNPWVEDKSDKEVQNLKVESLDDLFDDEKQEEKSKVEATVMASEAKPQENTNKVQSLDDMFEDVSTTEENEPVNIEQEEDSYDLQKELEAKFDELFGPMDE